MKKKKDVIQKIVNQEKEQAQFMADRIADFAEKGYHEFKSAKILTDYLSKNGFKVEFPWKYMPTAFKASWGHSKPAIGFLAEYDALPDCGVEPGSNGHACGHNLLGVASVIGAKTVKEILQARKIKGSIVVWGCPAEELVGGKVFMARDGAFRDNDAILSWHPEKENYVDWTGHAALDSITFEFFGKTAHGSLAHEGRSALDAVMLMDVAVNYLREHIPDNVRIHMCICDGGDVPNVVPSYAKSWYYIRGKDRTQVDEIGSRVLLCARGAALATETKLKTTRLTAVYHRLENDVFGNVVLENMRLFDIPKETQIDIQKVKAMGKKPVFSQSVSANLGRKQRLSSSDEENVSWLAPFMLFHVACISKEDVAFHHRDVAIQVKFPFAHRGMLRASEIFAGTAYDLYTNLELLKKIKTEFKRKTTNFVYDPLISKKLRPQDIAF